MHEGFVIRIKEPWCFHPKHIFISLIELNYQVVDYFVWTPWIYKQLNRWGFPCLGYPEGWVFLLECTWPNRGISVTVSNPLYHEYILEKLDRHIYLKIANPDIFWVEIQEEQQQAGVTDEAEPFMGSGRFGNNFGLFY